MRYISGHNADGRSHFEEENRRRLGSWRLVAVGALRQKEEDKRSLNGPTLRRAVTRPLSFQSPRVSLQLLRCLCVVRQREALCVAAETGKLQSLKILVLVGKADVGAVVNSGGDTALPVRRNSAP